MRTKTTLFCALAASAALLLASGCKKEKKDPGATGSAAGTAAAGSAAGTAGAAKGSGDNPLANTKLGKQIKGIADKVKNLKDTLDNKAEPLTPEKYEALIVALESCTLKPNGQIDWKCPAYKALRDAKRNRKTLLKNLLGTNAKIGAKLMKHKGAAVRWYSIGLMSSAFAGGVKDDNIKALLEHAKTEKEGPVLIKIANTVASNQKKNPEVGDWLIALLKHSDEHVRVAAAYQLTAWGQETKGAGKALAAVLKKDESDKVKAAACKGAGKLQDESLIPTMAKLAKNKKTPPTVYSACFAGAVMMWTRWIFPPKKPSRKAYGLTLALLKAKPRDKDHPPWTIVSYFRALQKKDQDSDKQKTWRAAAKFYKPQQMMTAIGQVITDPNAGWMVRSYFVDQIGKMGATKAMLMKLRKKYKGKEKDYNHGHVIKKLDDWINKSS
ncbi:MAG: HEAT repeat domain-containing protein [Myxococcales bacterium]|nr:HEAT repeat domain-containing protein [Myxococcales bacterium]